MEEVWKDMSLTSTPAALQYHLSSPALASYRDRAVHLQPPRTPPPPHTALTLEFTYLGHAASSNNSTSSGDDSLQYHLPPVDPFAFVFPKTNSSRRASAAVQVGSGGGDRRQRRMIKNRESAARSRARKQAYTNQLELEKARLLSENAMLIKRERDLHARLALAAQAPANRSTRLSRLKRCRSEPALSSSSSIVQMQRQKHAASTN